MLGAAWCLVGLSLWIVGFVFVVFFLALALVSNFQYATRGNAQ